MQYLLGTGSQNPTAGANAPPVNNGNFAQFMAQKGGPNGAVQQFMNSHPGWDTQSSLGGINGPSPQGMNAGAVNFGQGNPLGGMLGTNPQTGGGLSGNPGVDSRPQMSPQEYQQGRAQWLAQGGQDGPDTRGQPFPNGLMPTFNAPPGGMGDGFGNPASPQGGRINSVFGQTGVGATPLQRQSTGGISQFLNQPSPETRTFDQLAPGLMQLFSGGVQGASGGSQNNLLPPEVLANLTRMASGQQGGIAQSGSGFGGVGAEGVQFLRNMLTQQPGQGTIDALRPSFERNLAEANQAGGRFGTANAVMRSRGLEDFNLLAAQAAQQGQGMQMDAASRLAELANNAGIQAAGLQNSLNASQMGAVDALIRQGMGAGQLGQGQQQLNQAQALGAGGLLGQLGGQAGQNDFQRLVQGYGVGGAQAAQNDIETQRNLGILMNMFGGMQQATLGAPTQTTPSGFQQGAGLGGSIGALLAALSPQKKAGA